MRRMICEVVTYIKHPSNVCEGDLTRMNDNHYRRATCMTNLNTALLNAVPSKFMEDKPRYCIVHFHQWYTQSNLW